MLGMNSKRTLVSGKFAKEIKEKALRIQTEIWTNEIKGDPKKPSDY